MGLADEFTVEMAQYITGDADAGQILSRLTEQNAFVTRLPDGADLSLPPHDEGSAPSAAF